MYYHSGRAPSLVRYTRDQLVHALALRDDPFRYSVTEQEITLNFAEMYVEPQESLLAKLQEPTHTFVFADHGMGKSATRLALEYELRLAATSNPTLCVRYTPVVDVAGSSTDDHFRRLSYELAIDCTIQAFERFCTLRAPLDDSVIAALRRQAALLPPRLQSQIRRAEKAPPEDGIFWQPWRPAVERLTVDGRWKQLLTLLASSDSPRRARQPDWLSTLEDVRNLGFNNIYILLDAIDEETDDPGVWLEFLAPLMAQLTELQTDGIFLKCFLPIKVAEYWQERYATLFKGLTPTPLVTTIAAIPSHDLRRILQERLKAAKMQRAQIVSLDLLAGGEITESIEGWLAEQAQGSPRKIVSLASHLFDFHTAHGFQEKRRTYLTAGEWQVFQNRVHESPETP